MTKKQLKTTITRLCDFIITETTQNPLGLSLTRAFWPQQKKWQPTLAEFDDIGDYLTFVLWAGKILKNKKYISFAKNQLSLWFKYAKLNSGWYLTTINPYKPINKHPLTVSIYDLQDSILGLYEFYLLTNNEKYLVELKNLIQKLAPVIKLYSGRIPNKIITSLNLAPPWKSANPAVAGIIAEHLYLLSKTSKITKYEKLADKIVSGWLNTHLWQNQNLFHQGVNPYISSVSIYSQTKIMKENSNIIYALLQRPKKYHDKINKFLNKLLRFQHPSGGFFGYWDVKKDTIVKNNFDKTQNFVIIDLLTDIYFKFKSKKALAAAVKCTNFWLSLKDKNTDLVPEYTNFQGTVTHHIAKLDQSADFYSSLLRLFCLTKKKVYLKEAEIGAQAMSQYFGRSDWWHRIINTKTGKPANDSGIPAKDRPAGMNLTKYVGGALRFYLSLYQVKSGKSMQTDKLLWLMSRDR